MRGTCLSISTALLLAAAAIASAQGNPQIPVLKTELIGFQETPAISTQATGSFRARISNDDQSIEYELSYEGIEGNVTQAHIHVGQAAVAGGISVWLCSNLASPPTPPGTQPCPQSGTITGVITPNNVVGPVPQGIEPGEFDELLRAIRTGNAYANVHSTRFPAGEIRGQLPHGLH